MNTTTFGTPGTQAFAKPRTATQPMAYPGMPNNMPLGARMGGASAAPSPTVRTDGSASGWAMPGSPTGSGPGGDIGPINNQKVADQVYKGPKYPYASQNGDDNPFGRQNGGYDPWGQNAHGGMINPVIGSTPSVTSSGVVSSVQGGLPNSQYNPNATGYAPSMAGTIPGGYWSGDPSTRGPQGFPGQYPLSGGAYPVPGQSGLQVDADDGGMNGITRSLSGPNVSGQNLNLIPSSGPSSQSQWGQNLPGQGQQYPSIPAGSAAMGSGQTSVYGSGSQQGQQQTVPSSVGIYGNQGLNRQLSQPSNGQGGGVNANLRYTDQSPGYQSPVFGSGTQITTNDYQRQPLQGIVVGYEDRYGGPDNKQAVDRDGNPLFDKNGKTRDARRRERAQYIADGKFGGDEQSKYNYRMYGGEPGYDEWGNPLAGTNEWQGQQMRNAIRERQQRGY